MNILLTLRRLVIATAGIISPFVQAAEDPDQRENEWLRIGCEDAGYGGRPAFRCHTSNSFSDSEKDSYGMLRVDVWTNPRVNARLQIYLYRTELPRIGSNDVHVDPIVLKVDGRTVRQFQPTELLDHYYGGGTVYYSMTFPFTEALIQELASGEEVRLELTNSNGNISSILFSSTPASRSHLAKLAEHSRDVYRDYYVTHKDKAASPTNEKLANWGPEIWGPLGEATDRSTYWIADRYGRINLLELKWVEPGKSLQMRLLWCEKEDAGCSHEQHEQIWTIRRHQDAVVADKYNTPLVLYNEENKPVLRFASHEKNELLVRTFDPVLQADMERLSGRPSPTDFALSEDQCCVKVSIYEYTPTNSRVVEKLFGAQADEERKRVANAEAQERARTEEEVRQANAIRETRADRGPAPDVVPTRSFAETFAATFQQEMQAKQAQDTRQQAFLAGVAQQANATEARRNAERDRGSDRREQNSPYSTPQPTASARTSSRDSYTGSANRHIAETSNPSITRGESNNARSDLLATLEAITVCTKPSGANGSFECRSPVTVHQGNKNDISGQRTPEEMAMNLDGCPSPRRLASSTHLVWGCGFGATNNSASIDRSAGVDVKGRNTYYCSARETSCRRTTP